MTLKTPYKRFLAETEWLLQSFRFGLIALPSSINDVPRLGCEMVVVRLLDSWARFCRNLVVMSAGCRPLTATGNRLPTAPSVARASDVIPALINKYPRRRREPNWAVSTQCIDAADRLAIHNYRTVAGALGSTNSPVDEVRRVRNFFAHRGEETANEVRGLAFFVPGMHLRIEQLVAQTVSPGVSRLEFWIVQLRLVAEAGIQ